jgi:hypothetical protein
MNESLNDLYVLSEPIDQRDIYLEDLAEQCAYLEQRIKEMTDCLSPELCAAIDLYLDLRNELEVYTVNKAVRFGKRQVTK